MQRVSHVLAEPDAESKPVAVFVDVDWIDGSRTVQIHTVEDLELYNADRTRFGARHAGMTVWQYRAWLMSEGLLRCTARTRAGRRCKNSLISTTGPADWLSSRPVARCYVHREGGQ